jgi:hypothetical protein
MDERLPPPWHHLITGIPQSAIDKLMDWKVACTREATAFFVPFEQPLPNYVCTLEYFSLPDSATSNDIVETIVKHTLRVSSGFYDYLSGEGLKYNDICTTIESFYVTSLRLSLSATTRQTVWNVYCGSPPSLTLDGFFRWANIIHSLEFFSEDYGIRVVRLGDKQFKCIGCKGVDHPTGLCPFPQLPGWLGPTTACVESLSPHTPTNSTVRNRNNDPASRRGRPFRG